PPAWWSSRSTASASGSTDGGAARRRGGAADRRRLDVLGGGRQLHHERRTAQLGVLQPDLTAHLGHDPLADRETEAGALVRALGREERIEDATADLRWDARSWGLDRASHPSLALLRRQLTVVWLACMNPQA